MAQEKETVLLKISGESLSGEGGFGYDRIALEFIGEEIVSVSHTHRLGLVVGGGNFVRGRKIKQDVFGEDTPVPDYVGMMATIQNAIMLQDFFERKFGLKTRVLSALEINKVCEPHIPRKVLSHLEKERIVIFAGGIGSPDFSTDTTMVLRAHEIGAKTVLKGTKVDGIYDRDPKDNPHNAKFFESITCLDYLNRKLTIVDTTAVTLAMNHGIRIRVFNFFIRGNLKRVLAEGNIGSMIH